MQIYMVISLFPWTDAICYSVFWGNQKP